MAQANAKRKRLLPTDSGSPRNPFSNTTTKNTMTTKTQPVMTREEAIEAVKAKYPDIKGYAIQNVAEWRGTPWENAMNLGADAQVYGWTGKKLAAIKMVLKLQGKL